MEQQPLFSTGVSRALGGTAILLVLSSAVLALYGGFFDEPRPTMMDTYNRQAIGHRAWYGLLRQFGFRTYRLQQWNHRTIEAPMFFIEPRRSIKFQGNTYKLKDILDYRSRKGYDSVLVVQKWRVRGRGQQMRAVLRDSSIIRDHYMDLLPKAMKNIKIRRDLRSSEATGGKLKIQTIETKLLRELPKGSLFETAKPRKVSLALYVPQAFSFRHSEPGQPTVVLGTRERAFMLHWRPHGKGNVWIVSDPDLLHNFNLQRAHHAVVWYRLAKHFLKHKMIVVDECFHGHVRVHSLTRELGRFPKVFLMIQMLLLLALIGWAGSRRFGVFLPVEARMGRGPQEIIDITSWVLVCGQRVDRLAASYIKRTLQDACEQARVRGKSLLLQSKNLDKLAARKGVAEQGVELFQWADLVERGQKRNSRDAFRMAHKAWEYRRELFKRTRRTM
jgi:hypothetical protein